MSTENVFGMHFSICFKEDFRWQQTGSCYWLRLVSDTWWTDDAYQNVEVVRAMTVMTLYLWPLVCHCVVCCEYGAFASLVKIWNFKNCSHHHHHRILYWAMWHTAIVSTSKSSYKRNSTHYKSEFYFLASW